MGEVRHGAISPGEPYGIRVDALASGRRGFPSPPTPSPIAMVEGGSGGSMGRDVGGDHPETVQVKARRWRCVERAVAHQEERR
jgi:hypothetical protein